MLVAGKRGLYYHPALDRETSGDMPRGIQKVCWQQKQRQRSRMLRKSLIQVCALPCELQFCRSRGVRVSSH